MELRPLFQDIANAIREKDGSAGPITAADFPARIRAIPTVGGEIVLRSLRITAPPARTEYYYNGYGGEPFDPAGMDLEAELTTFGSSLVLPIDLSYVSFNPSGPLEAGTEAVTVRFRFGTQEVTTSQPVTVVFRSPNWTELESDAPDWDGMEARFPSWEALETYGL